MDRRGLRLDADYGASPLWADEGSTPIERFSLSPRLTQELHRWADEFEATTPKGQRMSRGGYVPTDWLDRGRGLARQLQAEVGDSFFVAYRPDEAGPSAEDARSRPHEEEL